MNFNEKRMGSRYGRFDEEQAFLLQPTNDADDSGVIKLRQL